MVVAGWWHGVEARAEQRATYEKQKAALVCALADLNAAVGAMKDIDPTD